MALQHNHLMRASASDSYTTSDRHISITPSKNQPTIARACTSSSRQTLSGELNIKQPPQRTMLIIKKVIHSHSSCSDAGKHKSIFQISSTTSESRSRPRRSSVARHQAVAPTSKDTNYHTKPLRRRAESRTRCTPGPHTASLRLLQSLFGQDNNYRQVNDRAYHCGTKHSYSAAKSIEYEDVQLPAQHGCTSPTNRDTLHFRSRHPQREHAQLPTTEI